MELSPRPTDRQLTTTDSPEETTAITLTITSTIESSKPTAATFTYVCNGSAITTNPTTTSASSIPIGVAAGIGIGTAIIGALLAAVAVWSIMTHRRHRQHWRDNDEKKNIGSGMVLDNNLLQRADDSQIRESMEDLNNFIDQHCENHYHLQSLDINRRNLEQHLKQCNYGKLVKSGPSTANFANMLQSTHSRMDAIRLLIATVLFAHIDWRSKAEVSLLPPEIATFCQNIPPIEEQVGSEEIFARAFIKWRHLSAFLIEPFRSNRGWPKPDKEKLTDAINRNVDLLNFVLAPFIKSGQESPGFQEENLGAIAFTVAELGLLIFSQPSEWLFSWSEEARNSGDNGAAVQRNGGRALVVFPGVGETIDRGGKRHLRLVAKPVSVNL